MQNKDKVKEEVPTTTAHSSGVSIIDIANQYRELGWNIFPIRPNSKVPFAELIGGSQNNTLANPLTEADIERIWSESSTAGIATHTGSVSGIVVIDIDVSKKEDGKKKKKEKRSVEEAEKLMQFFLVEFGQTRVHKTPSGGYHLFYKYSERCGEIGRRIEALKGKTYKDKNLEFIDIFAGDSYVLLPSPNSAYTELAVPLEGLADFPDEILALLSTRGSKTLLGAYQGARLGTLKPLPSSNIEEAKVISRFENGGQAKINLKLNQFIGTGEGGRHDALLKVCGTVYAMLPSKEWVNARQYVDRVISTFSPPYTPKDEGEIVKALQWAQAAQYSSRQDQTTVRQVFNETLIKETVEETGKSKETVEKETDACIKMLQINDKGDIVCNENNIATVLEWHPKFKGRIRYDTFLETATYKTIKKIDGKYYRDSFSLRQGDRRDGTIISLMIDLQSTMFPRVTKTMVANAILHVADTNPYDSYKESMDKMYMKQDSEGEYTTERVWDGVERLEFWMSKVFGLPQDVYHRAVSAQFIFAMVRRAYEPGALWQKALYLSGEQSVGKTAVAKIIASEKFFGEFSSQMGDREFGIFLRSHALIDLSEAESMRKTSIEMIKQLITDQKIKFRELYSGDITEHPIRAVLVITNNNSPLLDNTGNRRFLTVQIPFARHQTGDLIEISADRTQIFAEAVWKYHQIAKRGNEIKDLIRLAEDANDTSALYPLMKEQREMWVYEKSLKSMGYCKDQEDQEVIIKHFRSPYGMPYIPIEEQDDRQEEARMVTPIERDIRAVLMSYDEYIAGVPSFFLPTTDIYQQMDREILRQSRLGNFSINEVGKILKAVDNRLDYHRTYIQGKKLSGVRFKFPYEKSMDNFKERLDAIASIRRNNVNHTPPSAFGGGSKAVTIEQIAAKYRWEREGDSYIVITEGDIEREMERAGSVIYAQKPLNSCDNF